MDAPSGGGLARRHLHAQATILTGQPPSVHGVVGNGWYFRDTGEVRFWQQSNALIQAEPLYVTAKRRAAEQGRDFRVAKLFWWFNQGAAVDISVTPKPYYACDGNKAFGIAGTPDGRTDRLESALGKFPFPTFWGPGAGLPCTAWIARCAADVLTNDRPDLTLVYLPTSTTTPSDMAPPGRTCRASWANWDSACAPLLDAAKSSGAPRVGRQRVRPLRRVETRLPESRAPRGRPPVRPPGPFGEVFDPLASRAFAVCDHQLAHVYVRDRATSRPSPTSWDLNPDRPPRRGGGPVGPRPRSPPSRRDRVLSDPSAWFAYPFWLDDADAPDYARTVDIHRKPGYDPCELFFDPKLAWPKGRAIRRLLQKKLGFRTRFDVIPLDASLVRGSHGLRASEDRDRPLLIGDGPAPTGVGALPMIGVRDLLLEALSR